MKHCVCGLIAMVLTVLAATSHANERKSELISEYLRYGWLYTDLVPQGAEDHVTIVGGINSATLQEFVIYALCAQAIDGKPDEVVGVSVFGAHNRNPDNGNRLRTGSCFTFSNPRKFSILAQNITGVNQRPKREIMLFYKFIHSHEISK